MKNYHFIETKFKIDGAIGFTISIAVIDSKTEKAFHFNRVHRIRSEYGSQRPALMSMKQTGSLPVGLEANIRTSGIIQQLETLAHSIWTTQELSYKPLICKHSPINMKWQKVFEITKGKQYRFYHTEEGWKAITDNGEAETFIDTSILFETKYEHETRKRESAIRAKNGTRRNLAAIAN